MAHEVEVKIVAARDLKNVNWRHGPNKPYAVVWVDPKNKTSSGVDPDGDTWASWDETLVIPLPACPIDDFTLYIDIVHAGPEEDTKKLIGSARLRLSEISFGERTARSLHLKRPSGRPQGKVDVKVFVKESRYRSMEPYYSPPYGIQPAKSRDYDAPSAYGGSYGGAQGRDPYYTASTPPNGYPYSAPSQPQPSYCQPSFGYCQYGYGQTQSAYGRGKSQSSYGQVLEEKKKKFGMGTGLAVGAVAGALGGLALGEGAEYVEDRIAEKEAEKIGEDEDLDYDDDW